MKAVVVSFDRLPVGFPGCYGNTWVDTPALDRLAAEGVVFDRHFAERVGGAAACDAWWTGRRTVGSTSGDGAPESIVALLEEAGVRTALIVEGPCDPQRATPLPEGFGEVLEVTGEEGLEAVPAETPFARAVLRAASWLAEAPDGDWLLWVKSRGVPVPWVPPREFAERYVPLFEELEDDPDWDSEQEADDEFEWLVPDAEEEDEESQGQEGLEAETEEELPDHAEVEAEAWDLDEAEEFDELLTMLGSVGLRGSTRGLETADWLLVRAVYGGYVALLDEGLGALRRAIADLVGDDVLLIVTAGEGESLGERVELPGDWAALGEELVHTPLWVAGPGLQAGSRRSDLVQTLDVPTTLLEWYGVDVSGAGYVGRSWLRSARGTSSPEREGLLLGRGENWCALRTAEWYLVTRGNSSESAERWLFAKPEDVWDVQDVSGQEPEATERLMDRMRGLLTGNPKPTGEGGSEIEGVGTSLS